MATRDVPLPLRPDQAENLSGPAGALLLPRTTLRRMLQGRLQQRPLHPGARRKDEEHCLPESIALRERSQFGLCIYFEHNNKVHNKLELCTLNDLTRACWVALLVYTYIYTYTHIYTHIYTHTHIYSDSLLAESSDWGKSS